MSSTDVYYVYHLIDPRTGKPFYVGKGCGGRDVSHLQEASRAEDYWTNRYKCRVINSITRQGKVVGIIRIAESLSEETAFKLEVAEIEKYGRVCNGTGILTNIQEGGASGGKEGRSIVSYTVSGAIHASYHSLTAAADANGVNKSTICAALNGRTNKCAGLYWAYDGEELQMTQDRTKTSVVQYTLDGTQLRVFDSVTTASESSGVIYTLIVDCCAGRRTTGGGFLWAYPGECVVPVDPIKCSSADRTLIGVKSGVEIGRFKAIKEACAATEANSTGISDCCAGRKKTSGGISWKWIVE